MFSDIEKIDWSILKQAHGDSSHVPTAIKGLISSDIKEQESSYWKLDNHVVLQGDIYQAAFYVIPFLIEILKSSIFHGRGYVYDLLFEIANGYAPEEVLCDYDGKMYPLTEACKKAIADDFDVFVAEVANQLSDYRENALDLLISLEDNKEGIVAELSVVRENEIDFEFGVKLDEAISEVQN